MNVQSFCNFLILTLLGLFSSLAKSSTVVCNDNLPKKLFDTQVIMLGEFHGTNEGPEFLFQVVCQALEHKEKVVVILEMPSDEQILLDEFFASEHSFMKVFGQSTFWDRKYHDGYRSIAMRVMLERVRELNKHSGNIIVKAINTSSEQLKFNRTKAENLFINFNKISKANISKDGIIIGLFGRMHTKLIQVPDYNDRSKLVDSFGFKLAQSGLAIISLQMIHDKGTMWLCYPGKVVAMDCGEKAREAYNANLADTNIKPDLFNVFFYEEPIEGYHGVFNIGVPSSSEPAIGKKLSRYK